MLWAPKGVFMANPPVFDRVTVYATVSSSGEVCVTKGNVGPTCCSLGSGGPSPAPGILDIVIGDCTGGAP